MPTRSTPRSRGPRLPCLWVRSRQIKSTDHDDAVQHTDKLLSKNDVVTISRPRRESATCSSASTLELTQSAEAISAGDVRLPRQESSRRQKFGTGMQVSRLHRRAWPAGSPAPLASGRSDAQRHSEPGRCKCHSRPPGSRIRSEFGSWHTVLGSRIPAALGSSGSRARF